MPSNLRHFTNMLAHLSLAAGAVMLLQSVRADFWTYSDPLVYQRLDPVMQPGAVSNHTHIFHGANILTPTYSASAQAKSTCTTTGIGADLSSYWYPAMYYQWPNGSFSLVESSLRISYNFRAQSNETLIPYPLGLQVVAGYPFRRTIDRSNVRDLAVSYGCGGSSESNRLDFYPHACSQGLYAKITFPSCWDGKNLMKPDLTHTAWPIGDPDRGYCPSTHPKRFLTLEYAFQFHTEQFPYRENGLVFSFGDTTGLGFHADFISQWDTTVLAKAIIDCKSDMQVKDCSAFKPTYNEDKGKACRIGSPIINEDYGRTNPIPKLLGDNPPWIGTGPKPSCNCNIPTPSFISPNSTLASGFKTLGCYAEGSNGRLLGGAKYTDDTGMTGQKCTQFCASKGYSMAGTEYAVECYCGNSVSSGNSLKKIDPVQCGMLCSGSETENCGGRQALTLYQAGSGRSKRHFGHRHSS